MGAEALGNDVFREGLWRFQPKGKGDSSGRPLRTCSYLTVVQQKNSWYPQKGTSGGPTKGTTCRGCRGYLYGQFPNGQTFIIKFSLVWSGRPVSFLSLRVWACALGALYSFYFMSIIWFCDFSWVSVWEARKGFCLFHNSHFSIALITSSAIMVTGSVMMKLYFWTSFIPVPFFK